MKTKMNRLMLLVTVVVSMALVGCVSISVTEYTDGEHIKHHSVKVGERMVSARAAGAGRFVLESKWNEHRAILVVNKHKLIIEQDQIVLDGDEVMKISPAVKVVSIEYEDDGFRIIAGADSGYFAKKP